MTLSFISAEVVQVNRKGFVTPSPRSEITTRLVASTYI